MKSIKILSALAFIGTHGMKIKVEWVDEIYYDMSKFEFTSPIIPRPKNDVKFWILSN